MKKLKKKDQREKKENMKNKNSNPTIKKEWMKLWNCNEWVEGTSKKKSGIEAAWHRSMVMRFTSPVRSAIAGIVWAMPRQSGTIELVTEVCRKIEASEKLLSGAALPQGGTRTVDRMPDDTVKDRSRFSRAGGLAHCGHASRWNDWCG